MNKVFTKDNIKNFIQVNIGTFILALSLHFFLVPSRLIAGGASGFAMIMSTVTGVPMSTIYFFVNIILIILGIITIGATFGVLTIYSSLICSGFLYILENYYPMKAPFSDDLFINLMFGIFISATGISLVLNSGASTGGSDIVGKIIEKYTPLSFGNGLIICDGCITAATFALYGVRIGMYCILGVFINSFFIDTMVAGFNKKYNVCITSDKIEEINEFILNSICRGSTIYMAKGGYSSEDKKILMSVLDKKQYILLRDFVKKIDKKAFLYVYSVSEIEGEGFTY
ncbi:MAG: YitT family protein [Peptostreptococcaceae bacterium]|jgi:putative transporter|nr:YitT family protein [Peptostreptococcaceae bacterium]